MHDTEWILRGLKRDDLNGKLVRLMRQGHTESRLAVSFVESNSPPILVKPPALVSREGNDYPTVVAALDHLRTSKDNTLRDFASRFERGDYDAAESSVAKFALSQLKATKLPSTNTQDA